MFNSLHLAGAVGTANCPGAPRLNYFFGRPAPAAAAPAGVIPLPTDSVTAILARFADAGFLLFVLLSMVIFAINVIFLQVPKRLLPCWHLIPLLLLYVFLDFFYRHCLILYMIG
jgi:hypothetical protein